MHSLNANEKPSKPVLRSARLLDQVRERLRYLHYSLRTEKSYVCRIRWYIRWQDLRHPKEAGGKEVEAFLFVLANGRQTSPSTYRQALSALLFLYKVVLDLELPWLQEIGRPVPTKHIPVVLTVDEVRQILSLMDGVTGFLARLLYGIGLRLREALSLRVKDLDFDRKLIIVREGKGGKDCVLMLPDGFRCSLQEQLRCSRALWQADRQAGYPGVYLPHALAAQYPPGGQN